MDGKRVFGGNPLGVILRLVVVSIIVGIVMQALGIGPYDLFYRFNLLIERISRMGFGVFESVFGYFLLGAAVVIPIWLIARLFGVIGGKASTDSDDRGNRPR